MGALRRLVKWFDERDLHCYGGLALAGAGAWMAYPPAGLFLVGAALFYLGVWRADGGAN